MARVEREFARAKFVVVACTEPYAERFDREPGIGSRIGWKVVLIRQELAELGGNTRFVPIYFDGEDLAIPKVLRPHLRHAIPKDHEPLLRHLVGQIGTNVPPLGSPPTFEGTRPDPSKGSAAVKLWNIPPRPVQ